jgi:hypothetical protein
MSQRETRLQNDRLMYKVLAELDDRCRALYQLGFKGKNGPELESDSAIVGQAYPLVLGAVQAAETLLLYHKRLAKSKSAYGFLHQHGLPDHWSRYAQTGRIIREINQFVSDVEELLHGYEAMRDAEEEFIVGNIDLPEALESCHILRSRVKERQRRHLTSISMT